MKRLVFLVAILSCLLAAPSLYAQRTKKRPPKGENVQTPESAVAKKEAQREAIMEDYKMQKKHLREIQDKETRKRMKRNLKHSRKQSWGKDIPWYKRVFKKKKF
ncbi:MAG: hypothetical protein IT223_07915 [Crocinitomicaceae bacterium]|nr:hypothetical protein [Crocinitomicaceae bacterium]